MDNRESKAAAMRQTWLGDAAGEAVPWNELKQCVRDRWLAALDAAQPEGAALAAGGPQYCPADVAFSSRVPELERELAEARAEIAATEIELADLRFYQREFAAVSEERDAARAELAALKAQPGWELDVPANGWLADGFCIYNPSTGEGHSLESFVSHVCSRIRPAAARAALEGE